MIDVDECLSHLDTLGHNLLYLAILETEKSRAQFTIVFTCSMAQFTSAHTNIVNRISLLSLKRLLIIFVWKSKHFDIIFYRNLKM